MITIRPSAERGHADHGWLNSYHTFSFAEYHDPRHLSFHSLRVINEDRVRGGLGFGMHPHHNMEILTYVISGALRHEDNLGHQTVLQPGDVQRISAGTGVMHSEKNASSDEPVHFLQIWILPELQDATPGYAEKSLAGLAPGNELTLLASRQGRDGSISINQNAEVFLGKLPPGGLARHALTPPRAAWVQVFEGLLTLNGQALGAGDGAAISAELELALSSTTGAQFLVFDLP